ncbi:hypothetical protein [Patulibacter americanus]|uniref:hypothetical protein n=1 Tax=Patulibacter americanus TaxID=588672 RepID=UPI0003B39A16|nr:hypothetical protein [Patulibacter americanus]
MSVGWYVHHHGAGHLHRFLAVRRLLPGVVGLSSLPRPEGVPEDAWVALPGDVPASEPDDPTAGGTLHWAPRGVDGLRRRTAAIAGWAAAADPRVLVVDVSVEVALLGRLLSLPVVVVAQRGHRTDGPHLRAYAAASAVLAPWTAAVHAAGDGPPEDRLVLTGAVSRFDDDAAVPAGAAAPGDVLLLVGGGGHALRAPDVAAAAAATGRTWHVAGALRVPDAPGVRDHGPRADVAGLLRACGIVVATAGGNAVAEVAAARRPLVLLPQERPFDEQRRQAALLAAAGLVDAHEAWPAADAWPAILATAARRDPARWNVLHDGRGAERFAAAVRAVAAGEDPRAAAAAVAWGSARSRPGAPADRAPAGPGPTDPAPTVRGVACA